MSHWGLFTNSFGKLLHPVLWVYSLVIVLGSSNLGVFFLFNEQTLRNLSRAATPQALLASLTPLFGILIVLGVIGFVFATFGDAALIHLINKLEMRERVTVGMGLDGGEKIFQLLVVRVLLILPNISGDGSRLRGDVGAVVKHQPFVTQQSAVRVVRRILRPHGDRLSGHPAHLGAVGGRRARHRHREDVDRQSAGPELAAAGDAAGRLHHDRLDLLGAEFSHRDVLCLRGPAAAGPDVQHALRRRPCCSGGLLTNPIMLLSISVGLIGNMLATILGTSVWTLAYRQWRADRLPALPRNDFDDQMA